ncbi:MAG: histidine kinase [Brachymonas sp.]|nr:histidine kinase [Brachymonas sp.]
MAVSAHLVGAWVLSARFSDWGARCLALTGLGLLISSCCAAIYSTRELAINRELFEILSAANHTGATLFGIGLVGIFMFHPKRLLSPRLFWIMACGYLAWNLADVMWWLPAIDYGNRMIVLSQMLLACGLGIWQWHKAKGLPLDRAALRWVLLSFLLGAGMFIALIVCTAMLGWIAPISQGYAFGLFLTMYLGLALGVRRYRLFDLDVWSLRTLMWLFGLLGIVVIDASLISLLRWDSKASLTISMLVCASMYFPLRQFLWKRLFGRKERNLEILTGDLVSLALMTTDKRLQRWQGILMQLFAPNRLELAVSAQTSLRQVTMLGEGLGLHLPNIADLPAIYVWEQDGGSRLFTSKDQQLAARLVDLVHMVLQTRDAYQKGAAAERERIAIDLHDDLGARLLSMVHSAQDSTSMQNSARQALDDMRLSVRGLTGHRAAAEQVLADWRSETMLRLQAAGLQADWQANEPLGDVQLSARMQVQLTRILREAVSNVIRHAQASQCWVHIVCTAHEVALEVHDNGKGLSADLGASQVGQRGHGLLNIERRALSLGGSHCFSASPLGGACVAVRVPIAKDSTAQSAPMPLQ